MSSQLTAESKQYAKRARDLARQVWTATAPSASCHTMSSVGQARTAGHRNICLAVQCSIAQHPLWIPCPQCRWLHVNIARSPQPTMLALCSWHASCRRTLTLGVVCAGTHTKVSALRRCHLHGLVRALGSAILLQVTAVQLQSAAAAVTVLRGRTQSCGQPHASYMHAFQPYMWSCAAAMRAHTCSCCIRQRAYQQQAANRAGAASNRGHAAYPRGSAQLHATVLLRRHRQHEPEKTSPELLTQCRPILENSAHSRRGAGLSSLDLRACHPHGQCSLDVLYASLVDASVAPRRLERCAAGRLPRAPDLGFCSRLQGLSLLGSGVIARESHIKRRIADPRRPRAPDRRFRVAPGTHLVFAASSRDATLLPTSAVLAAAPVRRLGRPMLPVIVYASPPRLALATMPAARPVRSQLSELVGFASRSATTPSADSLGSRSVGPGCLVWGLPGSGGLLPRRGGRFGPPGANPVDDRVSA